MTPYHESFRAIENVLRQEEALAMQVRESVAENVNRARRQAELLLEREAALAVQVREVAAEKVNSARRQAEMLLKREEALAMQVREAAVENTNALLRQAGLLASIAVSDEISRLQDILTINPQKTPDPPYQRIVESPRPVAYFEGDSLVDQLADAIVKRLKEDGKKKERRSDADDVETHGSGNYL